jgi:hypothetical protein
MEEQSDELTEDQSAKLTAEAMLSALVSLIEWEDAARELRGEAGGRGGAGRG